MKTFKIAVGGAWLAGRSTMLQSTAKILQSTHGVTMTSADYIPYLRLDGQYQGVSLAFHAIHGNVLYRSKAIPAILSGAQCVVYILAPPREDRYGLPTEYQQFDMLRTYVAYAQATTTFVRHIPWIWVLNKTDVSPTVPLAQILPLALQTQMLRCSFLLDRGTRDVLDRILSRATPSTRG